MIDGSCLCGRVRYRVEAGISDASLCHCSQCRRASGAAFGAYASVPGDAFSWLQGESLLRHYRVSESLEKWFCSACGSTLLSRHQNWPEALYLSLGNIDGDVEVRLEYHQFVDSRASWDEIHDDLPRYAAFPEEE